MRMEYVGRIISPEVLPAGFTHLSGPYGIHFNGVLRVFFTSRKVSGQSFLESVPFFIDLDPTTYEALSPAIQVTYPKAELGSYRIHGVFPLSVFDIGAGALLGLPTGWRRHSGIDVETGIGEWLSLDGGKSWVEFGVGPKFSAVNDEPFLVCDAGYLEFQGEHFLAYAFGLSWRPDKEGEPQRRYVISVVRASDFGKLQNGQAKESIPKASALEVQAFPHLSISNNEMRMFFCFRSEFDFRSGDNNSYKLALATSSDGKNWSRDAESLDIEYGEGAEEMQCYPSFVRNKDCGLLLFNGDGFGRTGIFAAHEKPLN
jgi:hypothetical protein